MLSKQEHALLNDLIDEKIKEWSDDLPDADAKKMVKQLKRIKKEVAALKKAVA
jgi:phosphohistidine phosphatase SixA